MIHYSNFILYFLGGIFLLFILILFFLLTRVSKNNKGSNFADDLEKLKEGQLKLAGIKIFETFLQPIPKY